MSKTMYKTGGYKHLIEKIEVVRANDKSVWLRVERGEIRVARLAQFACYFDTIGEAKGHLEVKLDKELKRFEMRVNDIKLQIIKVKSIK